VTDIENSTLLSVANASAASQIQEIHDAAMREGISKHGG
jgi:hypothetical protein